MKTLGLLLAAATAVSALAAACTPPPPPVVPEALPVVTAAPVVTVAPAISAAPAPTVAPTAVPASTGSSTPVGASRFVEDARRLGVDFKHPLAQIPLAQKKKLMSLFVRSLGYESCTGCHVEGDFRSETRNLKIARQMWNHFVVAMRDAKGEPLFCDSCHAGKPKNLDRADAGDQHALKLFMDAEYKGKLTRADKSDNGCGFCHGYPFEGRIIEKAWGIAAK